MKARILSYAIALIALFAFNDSLAQKKDPGQKANPKINTSQGDPSLSGNPTGGGTTYTVCVDYIRITGLGDATSAPAYLKIEGTADVNCYPPGQQGRTEPNSAPGQRLSATGDPVDISVTNGNLVITSSDGVCATLVGGCKNKNMQSTLENVNITKVILVVQGKEFDITSYLN